ncbi:hypothetical protein [Paracraurococcus ruber]|uniref:hypothetical protein n=1 Tax=Paracraurococcus ruber TaxID=77675 RepID=UPI001904BDFE|nr:hypothetical protein [Paracraurococcus ruber]
MVEINTIGLDIGKRGHCSLMAGSEIKPSFLAVAAVMGAPVGAWFSPRSAFAAA